MMNVFEWTSSMWAALRSVHWTFIALSLLGWFVLSFVVAVLLGRMIRKADKAAGVYDQIEESEVEAEALARYFRQLDGDFAEAPRPASRREPTRSGPFLINEGREVTSYKAQISTRRGA